MQPATLIPATLIPATLIPATLIPATLIALAFGLADPGSAHAERGFVVSAGGDAAVAIPEAQYSVESGPQTEPSFGYFGRLSLETAVPQYTMAERGYRWAFGIDPDVEFGRSRPVDGGQSSTLAAGLRLSAVFSQKRMGLFEVSARGGFYLAVRAGLEASDDVTRATMIGPQSRMRPGPPAESFGDLSLGDFFLLGDSGLRIEMEFSMLVAEPAPGSSESGYGIRMRGGLGAYF